MKATVKMSCGKYEVIGLKPPLIMPKDNKEINGKPVYEMVYLHSFKKTSFKTLENAIRAILKKGLEYIPLVEITIVCGWD